MSATIAEHGKSVGSYPDDRGRFLIALVESHNPRLSGLGVTIERVDELAAPTGFRLDVSSVRKANLFAPQV